jgi:hypothetical protein
MKSSVRGLLLAFALPIVGVAARADDHVPEKYRKTVDGGLEFLVRHQHKDGHWEGDAGNHPVIMTSLASMALMMEGTYFRNQLKGRFWDNTQRAVDWLIDCSEKRGDGLIYSGHSSETDGYMYGHALAMQCIAWAQLLEDDDSRAKKGRRAVCSAVDYMANAQSSQGGWYRTSRTEGHDLDELRATFFQVQALNTFILFAQKHPSVVTKMTRQSYSDAKAYLACAMLKYNQLPRRDLSGTFESAAILSCKVMKNEDEQVKRLLKHCVNEIPLGNDVVFGRDELTHFYLAQVLCADSSVNGSVVWKRYRDVMFDHLRNTQNDDGSWPNGNRERNVDGVTWSLSSGSVYGTALWCMVLQMDVPNHPLVTRLK